MTGLTSPARELVSTNFHIRWTALRLSFVRQDLKIYNVVKYIYILVTDVRVRADEDADILGRWRETGSNASQKELSPYPGQSLATQ